jgi:FtsP/CotA-like multicopper oxidase with cupredoxin domain
MNDGVGESSFEVQANVGDPRDGYTYQFVAAFEGTYFYHCHRNTVLHFRMGLWGPLIVDPVPNPADPPGTSRAYEGGPIYDVEAIWATYEADPRFHELDKDSGLLFCPVSPGGVNDSLNVYRPKYFLISGVPHPWTRNNPSDSPRGVATTVRVGQTLLIRLICASYMTNKYRLAGLDAEVIGLDGRFLGATPFTRYSRPFTVAAGVAFTLTSARRYDMLVRPTAADIGDHKFTVQFYDSQTGKLKGTAETFVHVIA